MTPATTSPGPIATRRLVLEPLRREFAPALFAHFDDWEVVRWLTAPPWPYGLDDMHAYIEASRRAHADGRDAGYAIVLAGLPIGVIGVTGLKVGPTLGYWLARTFWGRGYMSEAAEAVVDAMFQDGHTFIASGVLKGNAASLRVQHKLGFRAVNERFVHARPHGRLMAHVDTVLGLGHWSNARRAA